MPVEVRLLQRQLGMTTISVTHNQEEALTLADRIAVMREGCIEQIGTPTEIYERPRSRFVADFIGVSNFLQGEVEAAHEGGLMLRSTHGMPIWLLPQEGRRVRVGDTVHLTLRPEKGRMTLCGEASPASAHTTTITHIV